MCFVRAEQTAQQEETPQPPPPKLGAWLEEGLSLFAQLKEEITFFTFTELQAGHSVLLSAG
jgi:hypothetical protein